jgi:hypothetical protein
MIPRCHAAPIGAALLLLAIAGCASSGVAGFSLGTDTDSDEFRVARVRELRALTKAEKYGEARRFLGPGARRWYEKREGKGEEWTIGPGGPWDAWDDHFRSTSEEVACAPGDDADSDEGRRSVVLTLLETNDYYKLLERGESATEIVYYFHWKGKIEGSLVRAGGQQSRGRTDEFLAWARASEPEALEAAMPGGKIDPSGDHAPRVRALLERWRAAAGLPPIP